MTNKELQEILKTYPDDLTIYTPVGYCDSIEEAVKIEEYIPYTPRDYDGPPVKRGLVLNE